MNEFLEVEAVPVVFAAKHRTLPDKAGLCVLVTKKCEDIFGQVVEIQNIKRLHEKRVNKQSWLVLDVLTLGVDQLGLVRASRANLCFLLKIDEPIIPIFVNFYEV